MPHLLLEEFAARNVFLERSMGLARTAFERDDVKVVLGAAALRYLQLCEDFYVPNISESGVISLPESYINTDKIPIVTLRDGEKVERDSSFATFAPWQQQQAHPLYAQHFETVAQRAAGTTRPARLAQTFEQEAAVMRFMHGVSDFPAAGQLTVFNLRPLVLLRYNPDSQNASPDTLANALTMCNAVLDNAAITVASDVDFTMVNEGWRETGEILGDQVDRLLNPQAEL